ncbi:hypothetical protein [Stakelama tenebrarum]|uniref:Uncharacterized protein n=1 Tax=Stakelama tenebrarum TaxID=2711215 RepID=A0A6G6Y581_9SPHN|nr:hypothetical protein [Sphingosinithalassobacter tenebrarum]QIG80075.1 hypothetical protein G5C33_09985 [Sphingosinithalassobacter tenebrarum]
MNRLPRANGSFESFGEPESQKPLPTVVMAIPGAGDVVIHQAHFIFAGDFDTPNGKRISVTTGRSACKCGCGRPGVAFCATPSVDEARALAARILAVADQIEAEAAAAGMAAIRKAGGKL